MSIRPPNSKKNKQRIEKAIMKRDTIIKILSLSLGLTIGIVLIGKIFYELSYDRTYKDAERIYLIMSGFTRGEESYDFGQVSGGVAPGFKNEVPGVEAATRTAWISFNDKFKDEDGNKITGSFKAVDESFFDVFSQEIFEGNPKEVLKDPSQVMVSETFAEKLGGINEAVGKRIYNEDTPDDIKIVGGVFKDFKRNGSVSPEVVYSLNVIDEWSRLNWIGNDRYQGYVKLENGINPEDLSDAIHEMQLTHQNLEELNKSGIDLWYTLQSLPSIHLNQPKIKSGIVILSIIAFLIITVSLMNYILVVVSGLVKRSRDIGVRKCYGAEKESIYWMLFKESSWQIVVSLILTAVLIFAGKGLIKEYTGYEFMELLVPESIIAISVVIALVFIVSVFVPSLVYQRVPVSVALRGYSENSRKWKMGLLGVQLVINVFIVCFILIVALQYNRVNNYKPGYDTHNILYFSYYTGDNSEYGRIISELNKLSSVETSGVCLSLPCIGASGNDTGLPGSEPSDNFNIVDMYPSSPEIFDIFNLNFLEGGKPEREGEIAVSKSYVDKMNSYADWKDGAVGKQIYLSGHKTRYFTISGVYDDILIGNLLDSDKRPSVWPYGSWQNENDYFGYIVLKARDITPEILKEIKAATEKTVDGKEVDVMVYADRIRHSYEESRKIRDVLIVGGIFSLLIALMGLIGFLNDESNRRTKELAIRKINGASSKDIIGLFYSSILKISVASGIVACFGAFAVGRDWLQQFEEKISLTPIIFISGILIILVIVSFVVLINCFRIITANPTKSLYTE